MLVMGKFSIHCQLYPSSFFTEQLGEQTSNFTILSDTEQLVHHSGSLHNNIRKLQKKKKNIWSTQDLTTLDTCLIL